MFLKFPEEARLSPAARDLITRLMCDVDERLGTRGVAEIKAHAFFAGGLAGLGGLGAGLGAGAGGWRAEGPLGAVPGLAGGGPWCCCRCGPAGAARRAPAGCAVAPPPAAAPTAAPRASTASAGVNWEGLHTSRPPYTPRVDHDLDTQNFEQFDEDMGGGGGPSQGRGRQWLSRTADPHFIGCGCCCWGPGCGCCVRALLAAGGRAGAAAGSPAAVSPSPPRPSTHNRAHRPLPTAHCPPPAATRPPRPPQVHVQELGGGAGRGAGGAGVAAQEGGGAPLAELAAEQHVGDAPGGRGAAGRAVSAQGGVFGGRGLMMAGLLMVAAY
jgi:hypothetical protein